MLYLMGFYSFSQASLFVLTKTMNSTHLVEEEFSLLRTKTANLDTTHYYSLLDSSRVGTNISFIVVTEQKTPPRLRSARNILEEMFGPVTQSSDDGNKVAGAVCSSYSSPLHSPGDKPPIAISHADIDLLADNSPVRPPRLLISPQRRYIPETITQVCVCYYLFDLDYSF